MHLFSIFEEGTFIPTARITDKGCESIITDYLGTPNAMYDSNGIKTWEADLDIYGKVRNFAGNCSLNECPFRWQGQYEDAETGLYYNRFRYYSPDDGIYISQDPIRLEGNNPTIYAYVHDPNSWVDVLGLRGSESFPSWMPIKQGYERHHIIPYEHSTHEVFSITGMDVNNATNMIYLPRKISTHPTKAVHARFKIDGESHRVYNATKGVELDELAKRYYSEKWGVERLRKELLNIQHEERKRLNNARSSCN